MKYHVVYEVDLPDHLDAGDARMWGDTLLQVGLHGKPGAFNPKCIGAVAAHASSHKSYPTRVLGLIHLIEQALGPDFSSNYFELFQDRAGLRKDSTAITVTRLPIGFRCEVSDLRHQGTASWAPFPDPQTVANTFLEFHEHQ